MDHIEKIFNVMKSIKDSNFSQKDTLHQYRLQTEPFIYNEGVNSCLSLSPAPATCTRSMFGLTNNLYTCQDTYTIGYELTTQGTKQYMCYSPSCTNYTPGQPPQSGNYIPPPAPATCVPLITTDVPFVGNGKKGGDGTIYKQGSVYCPEGYTFDMNYQKCCGSSGSSSRYGDATTPLY